MNSISLYFTFKTDKGSEIPKIIASIIRNTSGNRIMVSGGVYPKIIIKIPKIPNSIINIMDADKQALIAGIDLGK